VSRRKLTRFWPFCEADRPIYEDLTWDLPGRRRRRALAMLVDAVLVALALVTVIWYGSN
jgi:hypothetical protein